MYLPLRVDELLRCWWRIFLQTRTQSTLREIPEGSLEIVQAVGRLNWKQLDKGETKRVILKMEMEKPVVR